MTTTYNLDEIFGYMPFDHYLLVRFSSLQRISTPLWPARPEHMTMADGAFQEKWDPASPVAQDLQEQDLVRSWVSLGRYGRVAYFDRCRNIGNIPVPDHIPKNLMAFEKRVTVDPDYWSDAGAIWIRTWYGDKTKTACHSAEEMSTRSSADAAYSRLWRRALWPPDKHGIDDDMFGPYVFDNNDVLYGVSAYDADDEVELMEAIPSFVLCALMRCPDAMEGSSGRQITQDEDLKYTQALLVVVADGEACEEGWVLLLAINDKGQVLHNRVRCKAIDVGQNVAVWKDEGEPLDIVAKEENVMSYLDANQSGNGWDGEETSRVT